ncbi:hypothetical protein F7725_025192 [Dissostichus mawsoni]|uniref:Secreted protein n=1 Tax=Dissostichus mawsoni TaxID=36200 RepID=A0A7J5XCC9_DISMA|nr:hypothetical protein F7725_025192 [Dissostichus mawsoni]
MSCIFSWMSATLLAHFFRTSSSSSSVTAVYAMRAMRPMWNRWVMCEQRRSMISRSPSQLSSLVWSDWKSLSRAWPSSSIRPLRATPTREETMPKMGSMEEAKEVTFSTQHSTLATVFLIFSASAITVASILLC